MLTNAIKGESKYTNNQFISAGQVTENIPKVVNFSSKFDARLAKEESALENDVWDLSVWKPLKFFMFTHVKIVENHILSRLVWNEPAVLGFYKVLTNIISINFDCVRR